MLLPDGDNVAVQRIPSSNLATFVNRAVDGMWPSPGDPRNIRDETFPVSLDESGNKANLRNRLSIQSRLMRKTPVPGNLQMIYGPSGSNTMPMVTDTRIGGISLARQLLRCTRW